MPSLWSQKRCKKSTVSSQSWTSSMAELTLTIWQSNDFNRRRCYRSRSPLRGDHRIWEHCKVETHTLQYKRGFSPRWRSWCGSQKTGTQRSLFWHHCGARDVPGETLWILVRKSKVKRVNLAEDHTLFLACVDHPPKHPSSAHPATIAKLGEVTHGEGRHRRDQVQSPLRSSCSRCPGRSGRGTYPDRETSRRMVLTD